jgi:hypothetical protein
MTKNKPKSTMAKFAATLGLACVIPLAVLAADPQPGGVSKRGDGRGGAGNSAGAASPASPERSDRERSDRGPGRSGPGGGWGGGGFRPGDWEQTRKEFLEFCEKKAPNRYNDLKAAGATGGPHLYGMLVRFRNLQALQKTDPQLYEIQVSQIRNEDVEYGVLKKVRDLKKAPNNDPQQLQKLALELRPLAKESVKLRVEERSHRIARLAKLVEEERKQNDEDQKNQAKLIEARVAQMMAEDTDFFTPKPRGGKENNGGAPDRDSPGVTAPSTNASQGYP